MKKKAKKPHKHELYQRSVQNPEFEVHFIRRVYRKLRKREPVRLLEDFCGTAHLSCEWAARIPGGRALGIDLDRPTLDWGIRNNLSRLNDEQKSRVELREANVLEPVSTPQDAICAFNFSYWIFKERATLLDYFRRVRRGLAKDGIFYLDIYGGHESLRAQEESTDHDDFEYVWDQDKYNPVTGEYLCHIHFDFPNGKRMRRAFTYDWRLWSLPEIRDVLHDAGFPEVIVYWEGTDKDGSGNGVFRPSKKGDDSAAWIAYLVAPK